MPDATGLSQIPIEDEDSKPVDPRIEKYERIVASYRDQGLDAETLDSKTVAEAFRELARLNQVVPALQQRAAAAASNQRSQRSSVPQQQRLPPPARQESADTGFSLEDLPEPLAEHLKSMAERLNRFENQQQTKVESEREAAEVAEIERAWVNEYQAVARSYPILSERPEVADAVQLLTVADLFMTEDERAIQPNSGYIAQRVPQFLSILARGGSALQQLAADAERQGALLSTGGPRNAKPLDYSKMTSDEYDAVLRDALKKRAS